MQEQIQDFPGVPIPKWGTNLLFGQIFLKATWKWRKLDQEGAADPKFYYADPALPCGYHVPVQTCSLWDPQTPSLPTWGPLSSRLVETCAPWYQLPWTSSNFFSWERGSWLLTERPCRFMPSHSAGNLLLLTIGGSEEGAVNVSLSVWFLSFSYSFQQINYQIIVWHIPFRGWYTPQGNSESATAKNANRHK